MSTYADIIEKLVKATGPNFALDVLIQNTCCPQWEGKDLPIIPQPFTASLDAAIGLVDRMLPGAWLLMSRTATGWYVNIDGIIGGDTRPHGTAKSPMLAIALLAAMFRALEAQEVQP